MDPPAIETQFQIRTAQPTDHPRIMSVMIDWWGGRDLRQSVPKVFLLHFWNTSVIVEKDCEMTAFLVGFLSPANDREAYIHFTGVHPAYRKQGLGKAMYDRFFELARRRDRTIIRACTSPVNKVSIDFHTRMGFVIEPGDGLVEGVSVSLDYNRPGDHKVLFTKYL